MTGRLLRQVGARGARADHGFTLVELLVAMFVSGVAMTIIGSLFVVVVQTTADSNAARAATRVAANGINEVSRVVRSAATTAVASDASGNALPPTAAVVDLSSATRLIVTSNVGGTVAAPRPVKIDFTVDAQGQLIETQTPAVLTGGLWTYGGTTTSRTIAAPTTTGGTLAVAYTYADASGATLPIDSSGLLSAAQRAQVASVSVTVTVGYPVLRRGSSSSIVLTNQVGMPNLTLPGGGS